jgi:hypothetical protein
VSRFRVSLTLFGVPVGERGGLDSLVATIALAVGGSDFGTFATTIALVADVHA